MKKFISLLFIGVVLSSNLFGIDWNKVSKEAIKENKLILVSIEKKDCHYCEKMDKEIFKQKKYMKQIDKNYIQEVVIYGNDKLPANLKVQYFPSNFVLNPKDFSVVDEFVGYIKSDDFVSFLDEVYKQEVSN